MKIKAYENGSAQLLWDWSDMELPTADFKTLREYFQAERDEELGRWRDPEIPDWVVYPRLGSSRDTVHVINEYDGLPYMRERDQVAYADSEFSEVARRYFAAHPEPEPHPWKEAKPGEVWVLTRWGTAEPFLVTGGEFITADLAVIVDLDSDSITAGHRIWPEGEAS